jgi:hypothetical protein
MQIRLENTTLIFSLDSVGPFRGVDVSRVELETVELAEKTLEEINGALAQEAADAKDIEVERVADLYELVDKLKETTEELDHHMQDWNDEADPLVQPRKKKDKKAAW